MKELNNLCLNDWAEADRPREKMMTKGAESLSDAELIAILLRSGTKNKNAVDIAKKILFDCRDNLIELSCMQLSDLTSYDGIGETKALTIMAAMELGKRRRSSEIVERKKILSSSDAYDYIQDRISDLDHEEFWIIVMKTDNQIIEKIRISSGGVSSTIVDPKVIFKYLLIKNGSAFILCHNHPSNNICPSQKDIQLTNSIKKGADLLYIRMLDHIIVGSQKYYSFADEGML